MGAEVERLSEGAAVARAATSPGSFGAWYRRQRELRGISLFYVAARTKLSPERVREIEDSAALDTDAMGRATARALAHAIGADPDEAAAQLGAAAPMRLRATAIVLLALVLGQIYWGALVAGLRAGLIYNTWPLIDGHVVPAATSLFFNEPWWRNLFENPLTVQFTHRTIAYLLWIVALVHAIDSARAGRVGLSIGLVIAVTVQAALGIATLLYQVPISLALAHQGMAIIVLAIAVVHAERLAPRRSVAPSGQPVVSAT